MESQIAPHLGHDPYNVGLHQSVEGEEGGQHHEKKSVLKKVKAKAKKIKDTITKHGHGHDHEHGGREEEEEDDENEELVEDPELHGAPMDFAVCEAATVRTAVAGQVENPNVGLARSTAMGDQNPLAPEDRLDNRYRHETTSTLSVDPGFTSRKTTTTKGVGDSGVEPNTTMSLSPGLSDWTKAIDNPSRTGQQWQPSVNLGGPMSLEEDPRAPNDRTQADAPRSYEINVTDLAGRGSTEAGASEVLESFAKMKVNEEQEETTKPTGEYNETQKQFSNLSTGSHDQFSPEPNPQKLDTAVPENHPGAQSSYTQKISAATSAVADKAISAKDYVASKLGYGGKHHESSAHEVEGTTGDNTKSATSSPLEYEKKIAALVTEKLSPVYEKATESGITVISRVHGTGTGIEPETAAKGQDKGVSMKEYLAQKLKPSEEDRALSEVISDALHKRKEEVKVGGTMLSRPRGKVTESEEVTRRLGSDEDQQREKNEKRDMNAAAAATGKTVVDKLKDTVGSWLGKAGESQTSQQSIGSSQGIEGFVDSSPAGEAMQ